MDDTKRNILIVEDEAKVAYFLQESLESLDQGYEVVRVGSGEEAMDELERVPYDLVVSDLRMPGINGLELLEHVREHTPTIQTILITAYGSDEVETAAQHLQTYRYFTKPFHIEEFSAAVKAALGNGGTSGKKEKAVTLSNHKLDHIRQRLSDLRYEVGAQCIFLFRSDGNGKGEILTEVGYPDQLQTNHLTTLMNESFAYMPDLTQHLHEDRSFNLHYHEGTRFDIYTANVGEQFFLSLIFDRRQGASRIGMVWLYAKRTIQDLHDIIHDEDEWQANYDRPKVGKVLV